MKDEIEDLRKSQIVKRKREIFENVDPETGQVLVENAEKKPLLQTANLKTETPESDRAFVARNLSEVDDKTIGKLKASIEQKLSSRPKFVYMRCSSCRKVLQMPGKSENGSNCISCNWTGRGKGKLKRLNEKEVKEYLEWRAEQDKMTVAKMKETARRLKPIEEARLRNLAAGVSFENDPTISRGR